MQTRTLSVRLCAALALLVVVVPGCGDLASPAGPSSLGGATGAGTGATAETSLHDTTFHVGPELAAVRRATARFHDVSEAYAAGYTTENEPCVAGPAGAMGIHAPNLALILDPTLDPLRPELLLYIPQPHGKLRLVAVEYHQTVLLRDLNTGEVAPRFDPAPWDPQQYEVVNPQPQLFGQPFHLSPPPVPHVPWHWALHVWIWAHNPSGMFADWNPALRCP